MFGDVVGRRCHGCENLTECENGSCFYLPEDFKEVSFKELFNAYENGKVAFTFYYEFGTWVVRAPQEGCKSISMNHEEKGKCTLLGVFGCKRGPRIQPYGRKSFMMRKREDTVCREIDYAARRWRIYNIIIDLVVSHILAEEMKHNSEFTYDHDKCAICKGACCWKTGCLFSPRDFRECSYDAIKERMEQGYISIIGVPKMATGLSREMLVLKVRNHGQPICSVNYKEKTGPCILVGPNGCPFSDDERPYGGKALVPQNEYGCFSGYSFRQCAEDWVPYQSILKELVKTFKNGIC